ncbi:hypothetical protein [Hymenobacter canadensis]|uniref:Lipoprotein n=1 Tax=Hymenobacter canadensis TaxID=2999067 RepID=A0ABY7LST7_9BACT|nr:hypothetical protein [Hymenobacter canadensis]WBA43031.1 hypothetical protein O3303_05560 [Hymenobacter canadensis]
MRRIRLLLPLLLLAGCSAPTHSAGSYPQNPVISDAQGHPRDSTTFYFPADSFRIPIDSADPTPPHSLRFASRNLYAFQAPVLANYYRGTDTYRFLWLRAFHRPVLLTLARQANGLTLRTQFLNKPAGLPRMVDILYIPPDASAAQVRKLKAQFRHWQAAPALQRELAEANRPPTPVGAEETTRSLSQEQWQHFEQLLLKSEFRQLTSREDLSVMDGADWLLEAHLADGYHLVYRHSPNKQDGFRKACEYLLDLSSARSEERY